MQRAPRIGIGFLIALAVLKLIAEPLTLPNVLGAIGVAGAVVLIRTSPLASACVAAGALVLAAMDHRASIVGLVVVIVLVAVVGSHGAIGPTFLAATVGVVACAGTVALDDNVSVLDGLQPMGIVALAAVGGWAAGRELRRRDEMQRLRVANDLAVARSELSRDVHDVTSHALMAVLAQLRVGRRGLANADVTAAERGFGQAESVVRDAIADLRSLTQIVAGSPVQLASCATLHDVYAQISQAGSNFPNATAHTDSADGNLDAQVATTAIRVVQQCLANAAAHAPGHQVSIVAQRCGERLVLVSTNTVAGTSEPGLQLGLAIMAQRVSDVGGVLTTGISDGAFRVRCELPIGTTR
jgi:signal transduction histidine kinase